MPTQIERSQISLHQGTLENNVLSLEQRERHHAENLAAQRDRILLQMELSATNEESGKYLSYALHKWPFHTTPGGIIRLSRDQRGRSLNIIITRRTDILDQMTRRNTAGGAGHEASSTQPLIQLLREMVRCADRDTSSFLGSQARIYDETHNSCQSNAAGLTSNVYELLGTEPCALLLVEPISQENFRIDISLWGLGFQAGGIVTASSAVAVNLKGLSRADAGRATYFSLISLMVGLSDVFQATHFPHLLEAPKFPRAMRAAQEAGLSEGAWENILTAYLSALDNVASHSPLVASELAGKAAQHFSELGLTGQALPLIERGAEFFRRSGASSPPSTLAATHAALKGVLPTASTDRPAPGDQADAEPSLAQKWAFILRDSPHRRRENPV